jgi:hypothetical protein
MHGHGIHKLVFNSHKGLQKTYIYSLESATGEGVKGKKPVEFCRHLQHDSFP